MFGKLIRSASKAVGTVVKAASTVSKVPVLGQALKVVPGVGTALTLANVGMTGYNMLKGGSSGNTGFAGGMPALPGNMPALPGQGAPPIVGDRSILRDDPNIAEAIKPFAIAERNLRTAYRSPIKGYVVVRDSVGDPLAVPKWIAKAYFGWKPSRKPPISVGEWNAIKTADRASKKVKKAVATISRVESNIKNGKVVVKKRKG